MQDLSKMSDNELICEMDQDLDYCVAFKFKDEILRRLALVPKWRPISEAPKDGTKIIAISYGNFHYINVIWWWDDNWEDGTSQGPAAPSHFIPLPTSPTEKD